MGFFNVNGRQIEHQTPRSPFNELAADHQLLIEEVRETHTELERLKDIIAEKQEKLDELID